MIAIGRINSERAAKAFRDFLRAQKFKADIEHTPSGFTILVEADAQSFAQFELEQFLAHPNHPKYMAASWTDGDLQTDRLNQNSPLLKDFLARAGKLTQILTVISIALTLMTYFGKNQSTLLFLFMPDKILQGEIWRLITPIFLHFSVWGIIFLHLLFNMMWFWDLGGKLEKSFGSLWFAYAVTLIALISNTAQFLVSGPYFGGMSGVVFGLLGYMWIRGEIDPNLGYKINKNLLIFLLVWMGLGFTGFLGSVANTAHLAGLLSGVVLAWFDVKYFKILAKR